MKQVQNKNEWIFRTILLTYCVVRPIEQLLVRSQRMRPDDIIAVTRRLLPRLRSHEGGVTLLPLAKPESSSACTLLPLALLGSISRLSQFGLRIIHLYKLATKSCEDSQKLYRCIKRPTKSLVFSSSETKSTTNAFNYKPLMSPSKCLKMNNAYKNITIARLKWSLQVEKSWWKGKLNIVKQR